MAKPVPFQFSITPPTIGDAGFSADASVVWGELPQAMNYIADMGDWFQTGFAKALTNGTAALPSMAFASDPDTGVYRSGANELSFAEGGVDRGRFYGRKNILGTVSQAAGVPTGAVIESGSNANGRYTRWADGTQICTKRITGQGPIDIAIGSGFRSGTITIGSWAAGFSERPVRMFSTSEDTNLSCSIEGSGLGSTGTGGFALLTRNVTALSTAFVVDAMAVGRWY
jgi:hypothetical protein